MDKRLAALAYDDKAAENGLKPISFQVHKDYSSELSHAQTVIAPITHKLDLMEPFERLKLALNEVHRLGVGEKGKGG